MIRWWKNGDHPDDNSILLTDPEPAPGQPMEFLSEGEVVRRYRHPEVDGRELCTECGQAWDVHGWIDQGDGGLVVHPGDFIVGEAGDYEVIRPDPFAGVEQ